MKTNFDFTLKGKDWAGPFIGYWIIVLLLNTPAYVRTRMMQVGRSPAAGYFVLQLVILIAGVILAAVFGIIFLRIILPKLSIGGKALSFKGSIGTYIGMNVGGILLTIITLLIYFPWYARRITAYLVSETTYDGACPEFLGKGGKLFVSYLLCIVVPIVVLIVVIIAIFGVTILTGSLESGLTEAFVLPVIVGIVVFLIFIPFLYLVYKWYVNIRWNDVTIVWKRPSGRRSDSSSARSS